MKYYLGIDGGGTRTTAAVSEENGKLLFKAVGKSINFYSVGMEKARENLKNVINDIYNNIIIHKYGTRKIYIKEDV